MIRRCICIAPPYPLMRVSAQHMSPRPNPPPITSIYPKIMTTETSAAETIDGFQLVIEGLKLNGLDTIYCVPGIPITDLSRKAQAAGIRVISFRQFRKRMM